MSMIISFIIGLILLAYLKLTEPPHEYEQERIIRTTRHEQVEVTYKEKNKPISGSRISGESLDYEEVTITNR